MTESDTASAPGAFRISAAEYLLGLVPAAAVVDSALDVLTSGSTSDAVLRIGSAHPGSLRSQDLGDLVGRALGELGLPPLQADELGRLRTRRIAARMCEGQLDAVQGANMLWAGRDEFGDPYGILGDLIELVDEWESDLGGRAAITDRITRIACRVALA